MQTTANRRETFQGLRNALKKKRLENAGNQRTASKSLGSFERLDFAVTHWRVSTAAFGTRQAPDGTPASSALPLHTRNDGAALRPWLTCRSLMAPVITGRIQPITTVTLKKTDLRTGRQTAEA